MRTNRDHTLLVHSKQFEGEAALSKPIKAQVARLRAADDKRDDRDVLRGALNSVGRPGLLGEHIRCVVSVSMLTEGWDTRTEPPWDSWRVGLLVSNRLLVGL